MPYWLTNPDHGVMPVYDLSDVERNKVHGWTLLNQGPAPMRPTLRDLHAQELGKDIAEALDAGVVTPPAKRKPGRPPKVK